MPFKPAISKVYFLSIVLMLLVLPSFIAQFFIQTTPVKEHVNDTPAKVDDTYRTSSYNETLCLSKCVTTSYTSESHGIEKPKVVDHYPVLDSEF
jgi:hypothetical protein